MNTKIKEKKHTESLNDQPNIKSTNVSAAVMTNVVIKNEIKEKNQEHTNENDDNTETNSTNIEPQPSSSDNNQSTSSITDKIEVIREEFQAEDNNTSQQNMKVTSNKKKRNR